MGKRSPSRYRRNLHKTPSTEATAWNPTSGVGRSAPYSRTEKVRSVGLRPCPADTPEPPWIWGPFWASVRRRIVRHAPCRRLEKIKGTSPFPAESTGSEGGWYSDSLSFDLGLHAV